MQPKTTRIRASKPARPVRYSATGRPVRMVKDMSPAATGTSLFTKAVQARVKHKTV